MGEKVERAPVYGLMAEFADADRLLEAARRGREEGYVWIEAYTPMPLHELSKVLGYKNRLPYLILAGGLTGAVLGFGMQYYTAVVAYPQNVAGKPFNSWPSFIVVTFEMTILFAALAAVLGMLALNGLPRPNHPVFGVERFEKASGDSFFLLFGHMDELFDMQRTRSFLEGLSPVEIHEVPHE